MKKVITYGQMFRKLQDLGFALKKIEDEGKRQLVFTHSKDDTAMFLLPDMDRQEAVRAYHLAAVPAIHKSHGIVPPNGEPANL